jgi:glycine hydroxymethyltransferase
LRLGSPDMTTRGLNVVDFTEIANIISDRLIDPESQVVERDCKQRVAALCDRFPLYPHLELPTAALV